MPWAKKVAPLWPPSPALSLAACSLNTSTNKPPMILRLASGSLTPANLPKKRSLASTRITFAWSLPTNISMTKSPSFKRNKPWSTNTHVNWSPMARCIKAAATDESTPPDKPKITSSSPTCWRINSTASATWSRITQSGFAPQISRTKRLSMAWPCTVCVTSG